jgi:predicted site-specific integrase-resolvase
MLSSSSRASSAINQGKDTSLKDELFNLKGRYRADRLRRVSTQDQNLDLQKDALAKAGCKKIVIDVASGKSEARAGLEKLREIMRRGNVIVVWRLDRFRRSLRHLIDVMTDLAAGC